MQLFSKLSILFFGLSFSQTLLSFQIDQNYLSKWQGIEITGTDITQADKIRSLDIVTIGNIFPAYKAKYYCEKCKRIIHKKTRFKSADCGLAWYGDEGAYLTVEINGKQDKNNSFRAIPTNQDAIIKIPNELDKVFLKWENRMSTLLSTGNFSTEKPNHNFRDSTDPILHELAVQLSQLVPKYNHVILEVIRYSPDVQERQKAAQLFAWSNHTQNIPYILEWNLLLDPDSGVRNDIARSFSHAMHKIQDEALLKELMPTYCKQAALPSHSDRNKALISLSRILKSHPKLTSTLNKNTECTRNITSISHSSILENVKNPAQELLEILKTANHA